MAKALLLFGFSCITLFCFAQQKELDSLLNELKRHPQEDTERLKLLNSIAYKYYGSNPAEGIKMSDAAIRLAGNLNDKKDLAIGLLYKGINQGSIEEDSLTLQLYNKALNIAQQSNLKSLAAKIHHNIGIYYLDKSDYPKAIEYQKKSLAFAEAAQDSILIGNDYMTLGVVYESLSNYAEALGYQLKALKIFDKTADKTGVGSVFINLGLIYNNLEQLSKALDYYKKAAEIFKQLNYKQGIANALGNEASTYDNLNDSARALQLYHEALAISEEINYKYGIASNTANIGSLYGYYSEYYKAIPYLESALTWYRKSNDKNNQSLILRRIADMYNQASNEDLLKLGITPEKRYAIALEYNNQSMALAKEIKSLLQQSFALKSISDIYERQKNYKKAFDFYKQADEMDDSINNDDKKQQITRLEIQYAFDKKQDSIKAVTDKQQALAHAETQRQKVINNSLMTGTGFIAVAGFAGFLFYKRNRDIKTQRNEAVLKAQVAETEMKALRAQMNPHFIFNSLNSINDYIDKHDTETATTFTTKFAKLMRRILENSEHKEILLSNELQTLELYMQLEAMRLQNGFSYEIQTDEDIDKDNTLIPPLLLQPFLENSILHGIAKKQGGKIMLHIKKKVTC
jgi:tetratricopeptide (TPR) repeat protein